MATESCFCVFRNITIPYGSRITRANIFFTSHDTDGGLNLDADIYFSDEDDASPPIDKTDLDGRPLTGSVAWANVSNWYDNTIYRTPELKTVLQTVIDRSGWSSGNKVMMVMKTVDPPADVHRLWSAEEFLDGREKASLVVHWIEPKKISTPVFDPDVSFQIGDFDCSISVFPPDASIYYTLDGSDPDETDIPYSSAITITEDTTVKAKAYKQYWTPSDVATINYDHFIPPENSFEMIYTHALGYQIYLLGGVNLICDGDGYLHACFDESTISPANGYLKYGTNASGSWVFETVRSDSGSYSSTTSLKLDSYDRPHIAYRLYTGGSTDIYYANKISGSWFTELVASSVPTDGTELVLVGTTPHIFIWNDGSNYQRRYYKSGGSWTYETIGTHTSLQRMGVTQHGGDFHLAALTDFGTKLEYWTDEGGSWSVDQIFGLSGSNLQKQIRIHVDSNGYVHTYVGDGDEVNYYENMSGSWRKNTVYTNPETDTLVYGEMAFDTANKMAFSWAYGGKTRWSIGHRLAFSLEQILSREVQDLAGCFNSDGKLVLLYEDGNEVYTVTQA